MFHSQDPTVWISAARRKLQLAASPDRPRDQDKLLRKVLLRNSISRVDLALAEIQPSSSSLVFPGSPTPPTSPTQETAPTQPVPDTSDSTTQPLRADEDEFVFPDATSLATSRAFTSTEPNVEEKWLDSLLENLSDDEDYEDDDDEATARGTSSPFEEEEDHDEDDYLDAESLAWLLSTTAEEPQPIISVPSPTSVSVRALSPPRALQSQPHEPLTIDDLPFYSPLPDDDDDDLSTVPGMEPDEGESEADSVEWPLTPGQRSITSILGRSTSNSNSSLNQLVASAESDDNTVAIGVLPSITEDAVYDHSTRLDIHVDEPPLYRYSPNPSERPLPLEPSNDATPALGSSC